MSLDLDRLRIETPLNLMAHHRNLHDELCRNKNIESIGNFGELRCGRE
jgi:hypothetical protein